MREAGFGFRRGEGMRLPVQERLGQMAEVLRGVRTFAACSGRGQERWMRLSRSEEGFYRRRDVW